MVLKYVQNLADQVYDVIVDEICDGHIAPGTHLGQEHLAERFGVSRQPIQQAMTRLKADGMVEELGRRGLFVSRLDGMRMRQHYGVRAALDVHATRLVALRARKDLVFAAIVAREGGKILEHGKAAAADGVIAEQIRLDEAFHQMIYARSGNPMISSSVEPHWRFLRRAMGEVLRQSDLPRMIWSEHAAILSAIGEGDADSAGRLALEHVETAADLLSDLLTDNGEADVSGSRKKRNATRERRG